MIKKENIDVLIYAMENRMIKLFKYLLIIILIIIIQSKHYTNGATLPISIINNYKKDPVLLEVVNADYAINKLIIEKYVKEIEDNIQRPVVNINYLVDYPSKILPNSDSYKRGKSILNEKEGIPLTLLNNRVIQRGLPTPLTGKTIDIKNNIIKKVNNYIYKEYFSLKDFKIIRKDTNIFQLNINIVTSNELNTKLLDESHVLIFLVINELKSNISSNLFHPNIAYEYIPIKGYKEKEFNGIGFTLKEIINKDTVSKGMEIKISTSDFCINREIQANWSIVIIIENIKNKYLLFCRKILL